MNRILLAILLITGLVYLPIVNYQLSDYDDVYLLKQPQSISTIFTKDVMNSTVFSKAYYRPLLTLSFAINSFFNSASLQGFFIANIIIHVACIFLVWLVLSEFNTYVTVKILFTSLVAFHPALSMAVAWIPGRNDSLLAAIFLMSTVFWRRYLNSNQFSYLLLHEFLYLLCLLTKETSLVFPLVWVVIYKSVDRKLLYGWVMVSVVWFMIRYLVVPISSLGSLQLFEMLQKLVAYVGFLLFPVTVPFYPVLQNIPGLTNLQFVL